jgi:hypothetical protein
MNPSRPAERVIVTVDQATPEWLTAVLKRAGALGSGSVSDVVAEPARSVWATIAKLRLEYTQDARGEMPRRLFLKLVNAAAGEQLDGPGYGFGPSEVDYYVRDYRGIERVPLVRCYDAAYSPGLRRYHVLMDDLSPTHVVGIDRPVTLEHGLALAEGLAALHARWWGSDRLASCGKSLPSVQQIERYVGIPRPGMEPVIDYCKDELKPHWAGAIREVFARHPQAMSDRTRDGNGFTLIHGDVNRTNILVPREGDRPLYVIDRQPFDWMLTTWLATYDLSLPIVLWWDVETRRKHEFRILRHYHDHLVRRGITNYSMDQLVGDYRLSVMMGLYVAAEWCWDGIREDKVWIWKPKLMRTLTAVDDLECRSLWA